VATSVRICDAVAVDQDAAAACVAVTAEAIADSAVLSMNFTFWLTSLSIALLTGCIRWRLIDSSVIFVSWPHLTVLATDADAGRGGGQGVLGAGGDGPRVVRGEDRLTGLVQHRAALDLEPAGEEGVGDVPLLGEGAQTAGDQRGAVEEPADGLDVAREGRRRPAGRCKASQVTFLGVGRPVSGRA
jgi:hypothetical protein